MASKGKQLSELLDAGGDVLQVNLDNIVVNATSVSDTVKSVVEPSPVKVSVVKVFICSVN